MKKKGLIIATIVMVLVLAVSLTTATYAWFTASSEAKVTSIGVAVTTDAKVMIGVSSTNAFSTGGIESNFINGDVGFDATQATKWTGGNPGLGTSIDTGLNLTGINAACFPSSAGSGDTATSYTLAASGAFNANYTRQWIKTPGDGNLDPDSDDFTFAYANNHMVSETETPGDYLDVTFGVRAAKANIEKIGIVLGFDTANTTNLGMAAGFNYWYQLRYVATDREAAAPSASGLLEFYDQHYTQTIDSMSAPQNTWTSAAWDADTDGLSWTPAKGDATKIITIADGNGSALSQDDIYEIHVIIFLNGWDSDCNNSAASAGIASGSAIRIDFITTQTA